MEKKVWDRIIKLKQEGNGAKRIRTILRSEKVKVNVDRVKYVIKRSSQGKCHHSDILPKILPPVTTELLTLINRYIGDTGIVAWKTLWSYRSTVKYFGNFCAEKGVTKIVDITEDHVRCFLSEYDLATRGQFLKILKILFGYLYRFHYRDDNPTDRFRQPKIPDRTKRTFTPEEIKKMLEVCQSPTERLIIAIFYLTGLRFSEVLNIKVSHIDLINRILDVPKAKGNKKLIKAIPLPLVSEIKRYLSSQPIRCEYLLVYPEIHLYKHLRGKHIGYGHYFNALNGVFNRAFADNPERRAEISSHLFKHTFVTEQSGRATFATVDERRAFIKSMGWSNDSMLDTYLHIDSKMIELIKKFTDKTATELWKEVTSHDRKTNKV